MCLVWELTVNNTVPFGSELAAESQIQRIPFPNPRRRARPSPPGRRRTGAGAGSVFSLARTKLHFTTPPRRAESGSDRNTLLVLPAPPALPPLPLDGAAAAGDPPRQAGERNRGREARRRPELRSGTEPPSWPGGTESRQNRAAVFITTINSLTTQTSSGGKGENKPRLPAAERHPASQGGYQRGARSRPSRILVNQIYVQI